MAPVLLTGLNKIVDQPAEVGVAMPKCALHHDLFLSTVVSNIYHYITTTGGKATGAGLHRDWQPRKVGGVSLH